MTSPLPAAVAGLSAVALVLGLWRLVSAPRTPVAPVPVTAPARRRGHRWLPAGFGQRLGRRLARGGIPLSPGAFIAAAAVVAGLAALAPVVVLGMPWLAPAGAGLAVPAAAAVVRSCDRRHVERVAAGLPQVSQQLAAALAAGLSLRQALTRAARDAPEPIRAELAGIVDELALGARLDGALEALAARVPARDLRVLITVILVQRRTGGNLARALASMADRLEERARTARELRGATAQARMTAWLVAALPLGAGVMAEVAAPGTLERALGSGPGPLLLAVSGAMYGAGVVWVRHIGRVEE